MDPNAFSMSKLPVPKLDDASSYLPWHRCIINALNAAGVLSHVDGSACRPHVETHKSVPIDPGRASRDYAKAVKLLVERLDRGHANPISPEDFHAESARLAVEAAQTSRLEPLRDSEIRAAQDELRRFETGQSQAFAIIASSLSQKNLHFTINAIDAEDLMHRIKSYFAPINATQRENKLENFKRFQMPKDESLDAYLKRFEAALATLQSLNIPVDDQEVFQIFKRGLDFNRYSKIVPDIMAYRENPIASYNELYDILKTREETVHSMSSQSADNPRTAPSAGLIANTTGKYCAFHKVTTHNTDECRAAKEKRGQNPPKNAAKWCKFCKKKVTNHNEDSCFKNPSRKKTRSGKSDHHANFAQLTDCPTDEASDTTSYQLQTTEDQNA